MNIEEIEAFTLSKGLTTPNCIYRTKRATVITIDIDGDSTTLPKELIDIQEGALLARAGCGSLSSRGISYFRYGYKWGTIPNRDVEFYANEILESIEGKEHE